MPIHGKAVSLSQVTRKGDGEERESVWWKIRIESPSSSQFVKTIFSRFALLCTGSTPLLPPPSFAEKCDQNHIQILHIDDIVNPDRFESLMMKERGREDEEMQNEREKNQLDGQKERERDRNEQEIGMRRRWGVVGSSHSGILACKNIIHYDPLASVTCFAPSPLRFAEVFILSPFPLLSYLSILR